jgi:hypothetical protein
LLVKLAGFLSSVIPAKAGIQGHMLSSLPLALDPRFRGDDEEGLHARTMGVAAA